MCSQRSWSYVTVIGQLPNTALIRAKRSDDLIVKIPMETNREGIIKSFNALESYRICSCDKNNKCKKHEVTENAESKTTS